MHIMRVQTSKMEGGQDDEGDGRESHRIED